MRAKDERTPETIEQTPEPVRRDLAGIEQASNRAVSALLGAQDLERVADDVAREHAGPLAQTHGWFGRGGGLDVGHAKRAVGDRLGADLSDVTVRSGRVPGAPAGALASAVSRDVFVPSGGLDAGTPVGQALLAHELTHVVQQSAGDRLPDGPGAEHADRSRRVGAAPPGMAQHTIACTPDKPSPAPPVATTFDDVKAAYAASTEPAVQTAALDKGVATARSNASKLYKGADGAPIADIRKRYEAETGQKVSANPIIGVSQDSVERAYRAWAENPANSVEPWVLLALWVKEGLGEKRPEQNYPGGIEATSKDDARAIYRSRAYYVNFGIDVYLKHAAGTGDNQADFLPGTGANHDTAFRDQIKRQVNDGRLIRDISGEIDSALTVTPAATAGFYQVAPTPRFAELSLMLADAFYREQRDALTADKRVGPNPDPGLVYMKWNMKASTFEDFLNRAPNKDPDGSTPSKTDWAFHRPMPLGEYGQARENAMRFKYLIEVFEHAYQDK